MAFLARQLGRNLFYTRTSSQLRTVLPVKKLELTFIERNIAQFCKPQVIIGSGNGIPVNTRFSSSSVNVEEVAQFLKELEIEEKLKKRKIDDTENGDAMVVVEQEEIKPKKIRKSKREIANEPTEQQKVERKAQEVDGDFSKFDISEGTVEKLKAKGISHLFPVQAKTFDTIYSGKDVIVQARTGTGKTFSFAIPIVENLQKSLSDKRGRKPKVLVMTPTRELAKQVGDNFAAISCKKLTVLCVYGGVSYEQQANTLYNGVDVIVGTPGRLKDFVQRGTLSVSELQYLVLDEVDRMLDMGFADDVDEILQGAFTDDHRPQTLLFSATLPHWVHKTAQKYMKPDHQHIDLVGKDTVRTATTVQHLAIRCSYFDRAATINDILTVYNGKNGRAIIFCETKRDVNELSLSPAIKHETQIMHGDVPQATREQVLKGFRDGNFSCLVATDVAARGLDIPEVDLVIQTTPPQDVDDYIHRSGRTGRAGRQGTCIMFYKNYQEEEALNYVESYSGIKFKRISRPTLDNVMEAAADDLIKPLLEIPDDVIAYFRSSAEHLIEHRGAVDAVAAALAKVSGVTEIKPRSLLRGTEGSTTWIFKSSQEMRSKGYVWSAIDRQLPDLKDKVNWMTFSTDRKSCLFDLPTECDSVVLRTWHNGQYDTLEKAKVLPDLEEKPKQNGSNGYAQNGGSSSRGFGGGRGRGGRGGGRGRGAYGYNSGPINTGSESNGHNRKRTF